MKIEDKCRVVSAQAIVDRGLFEIRHEFQDASPSEKNHWVQKVIALREVYLKDSPDITKIGIRAAFDIAELFGGTWRLPIAANFIALLPIGNKSNAILQAFTLAGFTRK